MDMLDKEELMEKISEMENNLQYMSKTIDDFMRFYHPSKQKRIFNISNAISDALNIMRPILQKSGITLHFSACKDSYIKGYMNEYIQVVISILTNAKDILLQRRIPDPAVTMALTCKQGKVTLTVSDNAGGIEEKNIQRIFDPYFTTKHKSMGTGLGLYLSKMIIEKNMGGILSVENKASGAAFHITMEQYHEPHTH